jgi:hypothetical protein
MINGLSDLNLLSPAKRGSLYRLDVSGQLLFRASSFPRSDREKLKETNTELLD